MIGWTSLKTEHLKTMGNGVAVIVRHSITLNLVTTLIRVIKEKRLFDELRG
jgi:hypothetical protein